MINICNTYLRTGVTTGDRRRAGNNSLLFPAFLFGLNMRLIELFEAKVDKKVVKSPTPRNFVAKNAPKTGAGSHTGKKYNRKEKHKKADSDK